MEWISTDTAHVSSGFPKCKDDRPDPAYWTAYDFHMVEREARAARRAHAYSIVAACSKRLRQSIVDFRIAALPRRSST
jgi:hypothetical protein